MRQSVILQNAFRKSRIESFIPRFIEKGISKKIINDFCNPNYRKKIYISICEGKYKIFPPRTAQIPKDNGEYRTVFINIDTDRILLTLINDALFEMYPDWIHPSCKSYQKGIGTQEVVSKLSKRITEIGESKKKQAVIAEVGLKNDFSKYFDSVNIESIDAIFDKLGNDPCVDMVRAYYHQNEYFDQNGNLKSEYQSLKQGCAIASFLADVLLYDLDEYMSNKYEIYYRYSDDTIVVDEHINKSKVINEMNSIIAKYGIQLNPKKVELIKKNEWFKFLGFSIKDDKITLSKNRIKKFQKEIEKRSIRKKKCTSAQARRAIIKYLYEGEHSWASSCLGVINCEQDLYEMNKFIMDCIRACDTKKKKIGGLGYQKGKNGCIARGKGRNVKANRQKTEKEIDNYLSMNCLSKSYKMSKSIYKTVVRNM